MRERIEELVADPAVTDILLSASTGIWCDRGRGLEQEPVLHCSESLVRELASELIGLGGRHLDLAHPYMDVRLTGGIRVHAVLSPVASSGTVLSIRISRRHLVTWESLRESQMLTQVQARRLKAAVEQKQTLLITGASGAGKTSLLSVLLSHVPSHERIVVLEDVAELQISHPHVVCLEAQQPNIEGVGGVSVEMLVPQALRMRADRLVLGECRGGEIAPLLAALNTGHRGGGMTLHANSLDEIPARLGLLGFMAGMNAELVNAAVQGACDLVVHIERSEDGSRRIQLGEFTQEQGQLVVASLTDCG
ncbi:pilus assembly protein CpaF [Aurantimicrobium minutum]|uniref:CpaF family protein n=1 Tax=Aurantimicrobium minutum TaxID=708131 RepID=UPI002477139A|nr:ATPase, T2SS/T4P/T4SS family [Aurantimicrobium minutum]MDH6531881.1 pilus assembly protein CpaF [Aurantimicrobium minutum]